MCVCVSVTAVKAKYTFDFSEEEDDDGDEEQDNDASHSPVQTYRTNPTVQNNNVDEDDDNDDDDEIYPQKTTLTSYVHLHLFTSLTNIYSSAAHILQHMIFSSLTRILQVHLLLRLLKQKSTIFKHTLCIKYYSILNWPTFWLIKQY